jgi:FlaA1/EpsC-like NDP-sugar epimerase
MKKFDTIACDLLAEFGYVPKRFDTDEGAIEFSRTLTDDSKEYPVHFSGSDTSGEKPYEEFFTETESVDVDRFKALGVITNKTIPDKQAVQKLFERLNDAFDSEDVTKEKIVSIMHDYLPNFHHIETGKSLDSKM